VNDRELLELAAKAIGRRVVGWNDQHGVPVAVLDDGSFMQPLLENSITDCMGDALRLAVRVGITLRRIRIGGTEAGATPMVVAAAWDAGGAPLTHCPEALYAGQDHTAATRRAIVRAAAEIGKGMQ
jgi:hypothetical protein